MIYQMQLLLTTKDSKFSSEHSKAKGHATLGKQPVGTGVTKLSMRGVQTGASSCVRVKHLSGVRASDAKDKWEDHSLGLQDSLVGRWRHLTS